jgi:NAD-dependent SIR2 family protein deacetylase
MNHTEFVSSEVKRKRYWSRSVLASPFFARARPNKGHVAAAALKANGHVDALITQNVDRLHHKAGFPLDSLVELHGECHSIDE